VGDEWYNPSTGILYKRISTNGVVGWTLITPSPLIADGTNVGIGARPTANNGILQLYSYGSIKTLFESATVVPSAPTSNLNFDLAFQSIQYHTVNATTNFTLNIRGSASATLTSIMQIGQSGSMALMITNGATAYYPNAFQIDGTSVTPKWQGGTAISSGNANSVDIYTFTVVKIGTSSYTLLGTQTKFA
jgi:hypothetical protein